MNYIGWFHEMPNEWNNRRLYTLENCVNKMKTDELNELSGV